VPRPQSAAAISGLGPAQVLSELESCSFMAANCSQSSSC